MKNKLSKVGDIEFQYVSDEVVHNNWLFIIKTSKQKELLKYLNSKKIISRPFWMPMNQLPMYKKCHYINNDDNSCLIHDSCLSIPCSTGISDKDLENVIYEIKLFFKSFV